MQPDDLAFNEYLNTLPANQRDTTTYRARRYWELNGKPNNFQEALLKGMFSLQKDGYYHASSVAYNPATGEYEFMKYPDHPTIQLELDGYNNNPEFNSKFDLVTSDDGKYYKYVPKQTLPWLKKELPEDNTFKIIDLFQDFIKRTEGFRDNADIDKKTHKDGLYDYGYGFTTKEDGTAVKPGDTITREEADKRLTKYLYNLYEKLKTVFPDLDSYSSLTVYGLMDHAYRGGINNFIEDSPKFTRLIKESLQDKVITPLEALAIYKEMEVKPGDGEGVMDRKKRRFAMLLNTYNWNQNDSIGLLGGSKNTIKKTEYTDFPTNVLASPSLNYGYWLNKPQLELPPLFRVGGRINYLNLFKN